MTELRHGDGRKISVEAAKMTGELLLTVPETARRLGIGRSTTYALLRAGTIPSVTVGSLRRVAVSDLQAYIQRLKDEAASRGGY